MNTHIHKYRRVNIGQKRDYWVMQCSDVGCNSYVPMKTKLSCPLLRDQACICNSCDQPFILNRRALRMAKPVCDECVKKKISDKQKSAEDFFKDLEKSL